MFGFFSDIEFSGLGHKAQLTKIQYNSQRYHIFIPCIFLTTPSMLSFTFSTTFWTISLSLTLLTTFWTISSTFAAPMTFLTTVHELSLGAASMAIGSLMTDAWPLDVAAVPNIVSLPGEAGLLPAHPIVKERCDYAGRLTVCGRRVGPRRHARGSCLLVLLCVNTRAITSASANLVKVKGRGANECIGAHTTNSIALFFFFIFFTKRLPPPSSVAVAGH